MHINYVCIYLYVICIHVCQVLGVDFSSAFITAANRMKAGEDWLDGSKRGGFGVKLYLALGCRVWAYQHKLVIAIAIVVVIVMLVLVIAVAKPIAIAIAIVMVIEIVIGPEAREGGEMWTYRRGKGIISVPCGLYVWVLDFNLMLTWHL